MKKELIGWIKYWIWRQLGENPLLNPDYPRIISRKHYERLVHLATNYLPFGGVGNSGMGAYHGKYTFDTFTREKSVQKKPARLDLPVRYQPYTKAKEKWLKSFL